ncbi:hypothetical protein [Streptomyces sp. GMR22]|uniref:hypothetical protein n=1 Tax=Streptomyces sp. GMR22 TaxID=2759524 RepID=UPI0015FD162D|nr:hypothetical protein [Streptomyces sp. GMR22]MBA6433491.1 hypothetical protein [Streptomyces sp. GMR22]
MTMRIPLLGGVPSGAVTSLACLLAFTVTACGGSDSDSKRGDEEQSKNPYLTQLSEKTCLGIFDKETVTEAKRHHGLKKVVVPRDGEDLSIKISLGMKKEMTSFKPEAGSPCGILDDSGRKKLFRITVNWGPKPFPATDRKSGKSTSYSVRNTGDGKLTELLVDCQRPDLAEKSKDKKMLAFQVTLFDNVGLSDRADISILTKSAQRFTDLEDRLSCKNKVTYPAPDKVTLDTH